MKIFDKVSSKEILYLVSYISFHNFFWLFLFSSIIDNLKSKINDTVRAKTVLC